MKNTVKTAVCCQNQRFLSLFCFSSTWCAVNGPAWRITCRKPLIRNSGRGFHHFEVKNQEKVAKTGEKHCKNSRFCQDRRFSSLFCFSSTLCAVNGPEWCITCRKPLIRKTGRGFHHFEVNNQEKVAKTGEKHRKNYRFCQGRRFSS